MKKQANVNPIKDDKTATNFNLLLPVCQILCRQPRFEPRNKWPKKIDP